MAVFSGELMSPLPVPGFRVGTASAGIKTLANKGKRDDLLLLVCDQQATAAALFTKNPVHACCIDLARQSLARSNQQVRAVVANSGNANACTGARGEADALTMVNAAASALGVDAVLSASTGVIGQPMPIERIEQGVTEATANLSSDGWERAARAIMTTDTFPKWSSQTVETSAGRFTITGITKGSGMIHPNMATMLAFVATDAPLEASRLQQLLALAVDRSFNSISVDGDTSTNDTIYLLAGGSGRGLSPLAGEDEAAFAGALTVVCRELATLIVRDGEGVSKFVTIHVAGARSEAEARTIGRSVAISPLVKTAFAGNDANWGRILAAVGNSGVPLDPSRLSLKAEEVLICQNGGLHPDYRDADGMAIFARDEFSLTIGLGLGDASATVWTGDFTNEYIRINAEYRT